MNGFREFRIARVPDMKGEGTFLANVGKTGKLHDRKDVRRTNIVQVARWYAVEATSFAEATRRIRIYEEAVKSRFDVIVELVDVHIVERFSL